MTMSDFMRTLISMSLSGSIVAVVLVALKPLITKRLSRTWQYYVWLIVVLRLLLPLSPTITITGNVLPGMTYTNMSPVVTTAPVTTTPAGTTPATSTPAGVPATPMQTAPHTTPAAANGGATRSVSVLLLMLWAIGASAVMVYNTAGYARFKRMVRRTAVRVTDSRLLTILEACRQETHVRVSPALYTSTLVTSPILLGAIHPAIVLPDRLSTDNELRYALLHELTHARRQDALLKWATVIATSIHWFNPLAYVVQREMDRSCELACDEAVTMRFSADDRRGYGSMLLAVASAAGAPSPAMFSAMVEEKRNLKERLGTIMSSKKQTKRTMAVSIVAAFLIAGIALLAGCTFTAKQSGIQQPAALSQIRMITQKTGWALTKDNQILKTADGGATWANVSVPALLQTQASWESLPTSACFVDEQTAFVAAPSGPASYPHGIVYRTGDQGKTWSSVQLPSGTSWERYDINGLLVDFPDASHGYIMTTSSPGLGQMLKALYKTDDGGKTYSFVKEITGFTDVQGKFSGIEGYPTGMAFSSATTGFVTCTYHGQENPQIYKTTDGGLTWGLALQQLPTPGSTYALSFPQGEVPNDNGENGYINGYSPLFIGTKRTDGLMLLDRRNGEVTSLQVYRTHDGGATWAPAELMENKSIHTCSFSDSRNGYGIDDTGKLFATSDGGLHWTAATMGSPQVSMMGLTNVTSSEYDTVPLLWNVGQNTLQSSATSVLHVNDVNGEGVLRWSSGSPILAVQHWSYPKNRIALMTATSKDLNLLVPPVGMQYSSAMDGPLTRWYVPDENAFVSVPAQPGLSNETPGTKTITITEQGVASGSKAQTLTVPVPSNLTQIEGVLYGSGSITNGFVLVETRDEVVTNASASLWLLRINNGTGSWVRCGDLSAFDGNFAGQDPSFARVGSLLYMTHSHTKIGCIDTAAASPTVTLPENINTLLTQLYSKGPTKTEFSLQAQLSSDNGTLIIAYPDANWNTMYYAVDPFGTVLGSLRADKTSITSFDAKGKQGSSLPFKDAWNNTRLPSIDLFEWAIF
jgi:beta-lactamase regulating signal transducer with metallopeptidase domain/photosystem II stability/assembly factor-like uncharacterized protein